MKTYLVRYEKISEWTVTIDASTPGETLDQAAQIWGDQSCYDDDNYDQISFDTTWEETE